MEQAHLTSEEIRKRGERLYEHSIRAQVETEANIGNIIVLDVQSGDYEIAAEGLTAGRRLQQRHPDAAMLCLRIGYDAVYSFGSVLTRTKP